MLNASQNRTKRAPLTDASMSSVPARCAGWLATMPTAPAAEPREADDDVPRVVACTSRNVAVVDDRVHRRRACRTAGSATPARACRAPRPRGRSGSRVSTPRRIVEVVAGQDTPSSSRIEREAFAIVGDGEVRDAARLVVRHGAAELLFRHLLVRDGPDHVRAGHEHVARALDHDVEVGDRGRIDRAAGARPHDRGDLRDDAGRQRVAQEDVGVAAEREHAFLDARAARVVEPDDRRAHLHRQVHDLDDLGGVGFRERAAEDGEVLREGVDRAARRPVRAPATTPSPGTICSSMPKSRQRWVTSLSTSSNDAGIEQQVDPLARVSLPAVVLPLAARSSPPPSSARRSRSCEMRQSSVAMKAATPSRPAPSPSPSGTSRARCRSADA